MNRRKAKKQVKKKWRNYGLKRWPGNMSPRQVDAVYSFVTAELTKAIGQALDQAILYGSGDGGLHTFPTEMLRKL